MVYALLVGDKVTKRLFILIPSIGGGGAERVVSTLLKYLSRKRWKVTLVVIHNDDKDRMYELPKDIEYVNLNRKRVRHAIPDIVYLLWKQRPDLVFSTLGHLNLALSIVRRILPGKTVIVARESSIVSRMNQYHAYPRLWSSLYRKFYLNFDSIICQSSAMAKDLFVNYGIPKNKVNVVCNPIDISVVRSKSLEPIVTNINTKNWMEYGGLKLLAVGRLSPEKGFDLLVDAIDSCRDLPIKLLILGSGQQSTILQEKVQSLGLSSTIYFNGFVKNPYSYMLISDCFVLSSHFEGFPNAVLEAATLGTPIVATPAEGGLFEILKDIPGCEIAKDVSSSALSEALRKWCASTRSRLPLECTENFGAENIVAQYEEVFRNAIESAR